MLPAPAAVTPRSRTDRVSVGDYDLVRQAYRLLRAEELFWKLKIKPGKPTAAARKNGKILLGLSATQPRPW